MRFNIFRKPESKVATWIKNNYFSVLILGALIAIMLCILIGLMQSVWFDEAYSIMLAKQPVSEIFRLTSLDTHPPFYYLLLSVWGNIFGWSELALRSLSVLAMGGTVFFSGLLTKKLFGTRTALISLPFVVFAPFLLRYGFEIRMYSVASLIGITATYVLIWALESKKSKQIWLYVLYALLVALGVYTLYYTVLLWVAHLVWLLWRSYSNKESAIKANWLKAYLLSAVFFLPWLPTFLKQVTNGALAPISQSMTVDNLFGIISFNFLYRPIWQLDALLSLVMVFVIMAVCYLSFRAFKIVDKKRKSYLILLAAYILIPVAIITLVGLIRPMYVERYLAHVLIGGMLFIGVSAALVTEKAKQSTKIATALLMIIMAAGVVQLIQVGNYNFQRLQRPNVNQIAATIKECKLNSVVLAADPYTAIELSYYLKCPIHFYSETKKLSGGYSALSNSDLHVADTELELKNFNEIYYVYYGSSKLKMPSSFSKANQIKYDALTVERYTSISN